MEGSRLAAMAEWICFIHPPRKDFAAAWSVGVERSLLRGRDS